MSQRSLCLVVSNDINGLYELCVARDVVFENFYSPVLTSELGWKKGRPPISDFAEFIRRFYSKGYPHELPWLERLRALVKEYFLLQLSSCLVNREVRQMIVHAEFDRLYELNCSAIKLKILDTYPFEMASIIFAAGLRER